jgi:ectoine hydroxylase-related dioxygenase (phytanoyl-CoA dioxygenase family)
MAANPTAINTQAQPFTESRMAAIASDFHRDGYAVIRGVLEPAEITAMIAAIDRIFADPRSQDEDRLYGPYIAVRLFERDPLFEELMTREPIIGLAEYLLGKDCHLMANNIVRNRPGEAISTFHVDDLVIFPLPDDVPRHDPRLTMPVHLLTVQMPLTPVRTLAQGPTQFVPGSHYSGRQPNDPQAPVFEGRGPVTLYTEPGDLFLHNGQCWHRGAPNTSTDTRYLLQLTYSRRWVSQRFYPFVNYQLPPAVLARADERRRRVLGLHGKGPYG